jgi:hypothetical protein
VEEYKKLFEQVHEVVYDRLTDLPDKALQVREAAIGGLERALVLTTILHYTETSGYI